MVYDWEDKQETCYRMYVVERKSLDDVMKFFKDEVGFVPSKRAFQTQFRRWAFPSKQNPAHRNEALVARTRELWEKNTTQKDMIGVLQAEGFTVTERELMRLRSKHRLLLREANTSKTTPVDDVQPMSESISAETIPSVSSTPMMPTSESLEDAPSSKRKGRLDELQKDSDARWESKKRRRRTRGWAGLPADPPGPPRFPSETTLEASKACLGLDTPAYLEVRSTFQTICQEQNIIKKTLAGPERWQAAKNHLLQSNLQVSQAFQHATQPELEQLRLSLDVICMDVTKRLRTMEHSMTLAEAKNLLKINPEEGRQFRQALMDLLTAHNFVNKHESDNWDQLKQLWITQSGLVHRIPSAESGNREQGLRAVQTLCRDIMKRWRDGQILHGNSKPEKRTPSQSKSVQQGVTRPAGPASDAAYGNQLVTTSTPGEESRVVPGQQQSILESSYDFQIDPTLLMAARETPLTLQNPYSGNGTVIGFSESLHEAGSHHASVYFS